MNLATQKVMFSSKTDDWATPQAFFDEVNREFVFVLDACASITNYKAPHFYIANSLEKDWSWAERVWMNPPYGRTIGQWVKKASEEAAKGCTVVCLLPARTDTRWFHDYCYSKAEVRFIRGRLKFGGAKNSAPFPSMLVIFKGEIK